MFAVFDIETRVDKRLLNQAMCAGEGLSDEDAFQRFREELRARRGSDFFPLSLHIPISIAIGNVGDDHVLRSVESLALDDYSEEALVREFWARAERFAGCLVTLQRAALRFSGARTRGPAPRNRRARAFRRRQPVGARPLFDRAPSRSLRLPDQLRRERGLRGGMNLLLKMIGLPGKTGIDGSQVQEFYEQGRLEEIHRYCRNDVMQTYFLFLRVELMRGRIDEAAYRLAREASAHFLAEIGAPPPAGEPSPGQT